MLIFLLVLLIDSCKSYLENNSLKIIPSSKMYNIIIVSFLKEILFTIVKRYEVHAKPCKESWRTLYRKCGNESEKIITHNLEKFVFVSQAKMWLYFHESTVWKRKRLEMSFLPNLCTFKGYKCIPIADLMKN